MKLFIDYQLIGIQNIIIFWFLDRITQCNLYWSKFCIFLLNYKVLSKSQKKYIKKAKIQVCKNMVNHRYPNIQLITGIYQVDLQKWQLLQLDYT